MQLGAYLCIELQLFYIKDLRSDIQIDENPLC